MKPGRILLILGVIIIGIIIYLNKCNKEDGPSVNQNKGNQPQAMMVNGLVISAEPIEDKIYASGTLLANDEVEIKNEIPGRVTSILFKEGKKVSKGELLVTLYDEDLKAQLKKLQLQKELAQKTDERQKDLLEINGISQQDYDLSYNQLQSINADIEILESELSKTKIRAPFDGIIGLRTVSAGAFLSVNTKIVTMQALDPMKLEFSIPERYRTLLNDNAEIKFTTESSEGFFTGTIYAFEPKIDLQTRSVIVRALCSNKDLKLFPGAFAHVEIPLKKIDNAILIPTQALIPELKGQKVFITKGGKAEKVDVETGVRNDTSIQITKGIQVGDTILISGLMQVRPGTPLKVSINKK
jgi:membrane fusion protein (multidrug efflux system)